MIKVETVLYQQASLKIKKQINDLLQDIWPSANDSEAHDSDLVVQSFYVMIDSRIVSYAAVIRLQVIIKDKLYQIGGLSCVATLPSFQGQGLGCKIVARATKWMEDNLDFGVFTCAPDLVDFYYRAGNWKAMSNVVLIGNHDNDALSSRNLDVIVLMRIFSKKALSNYEEITNSIIYLGFSKGQFI
ncbi:GNAT family N-acetyltransferase [Thomasclavelia cocleata]|uniref:GNAT family N-acetyltransferase n=1 Tax=Thomasclavelia cocleata TaxID=69824 RepID=UPI00249439EA|nr:GNAT family N-acetyltransferase [Thomasclavelia cocleata]